MANQLAFYIRVNHPLLFQVSHERFPILYIKPLIFEVSQPENVSPFRGLSQIEVWFSTSASPSALLPLLSLNFKDISASREAEIMFGNCILAADLTKTYYFATVPEIADRLCVSNVCIPVYLCACVGRVHRAERLLIKVLYVWLNISQPEHWVHYVSVCVRALLDGILMALKLKHDPAVDDVSLPKAQTLYQTSCQQMSLLEIGGEAARGILYMLVLHKIVHCDDIYQKINRLKH